MHALADQRKNTRIAMAVLPDNRYRVAVGILINDKGEVLMAQRASTQEHPNRFEFPGGKFEAGETLDEALARELFEEIGIVVRSHRWLTDVLFDYPQRKVQLIVHQILDYDGTPHSKESQPLFWVPLQNIRNYELPEANYKIVDALTEKSLYPS